MKSEKPIGIFDSGIGGFTVAKAIRNLLPKESLLYFGDTAHLPYGEKSADAIQQYALQIGAFFPHRTRPGRRLRPPQGLGPAHRRTLARPHPQLRARIGRRGRRRICPGDDRSRNPAFRVGQMDLGGRTGQGAAMMEEPA